MCLFETQKFQNLGRQDRHYCIVEVISLAFFFLNCTKTKTLALIIPNVQACLQSKRKDEAVSSNAM